MSIRSFRSALTSIFAPSSLSIDKDSVAAVLSAKPVVEETPVAESVLAYVAPVSSIKASSEMTHVPTGVRALDDYLGGGLRAGEITTFLIHDMPHWMPWFAELFRTNYNDQASVFYRNVVCNFFESLKDPKQWNHELAFPCTDKLRIIWLPQHTEEAIAKMWDSMGDPAWLYDSKKAVVFLRTYNSDSPFERQGEGMGVVPIESVYLEGKGVFKHSHTVIQCCLKMSRDEKAFQIRLMKHPTLPLPSRFNLNPYIKSPRNLNPYINVAHQGLAETTISAPSVSAEIKQRMAYAAYKAPASVTPTSIEAVPEDMKHVPIIPDNVKCIPTGIQDLDRLLGGWHGGGLRVGEVTTFIIHDTGYWMPWFANLYRKTLRLAPFKNREYGARLEAMIDAKQHGSEVTLGASKFFFHWPAQGTHELSQRLWDSMPNWRLAAQRRPEQPTILLRSFDIMSDFDRDGEGFLKSHAAGNLGDYWANVRNSNLGVFKDSDTVIMCYGSCVAKHPLRLVKHPERPITNAFHNSSSTISI